MSDIWNQNCAVGSQTVRLCGIDLAALNGRTLNYFLSLLNQRERVDADAFLRGDQRTGFVATRALARIQLSKLSAIAPCDWRFENDGGKPVVRDLHSKFTDLTCSWSHCRDFAIVGVTRGGAIGVDIEPVMRPLDISKIAKRHFAQSEIATLTATAGDRARSDFMRMWTIKEAVLKAAGVGLGSALGGVEVSLAEMRLRSLPVALGAPAQWSVHSMAPTDRYIAAVAVRFP